MSSEWDRSETTAVGSVPLALSFGLSSDVALQSDDECDRGTISVRSFTGDCKDVKSVCVPVVACSDRNLQMWPAFGRPQRPQRYGLRGLCARFFFSTGAAAAVASKSVNSPLAASLSPIAKACGTCFARGRTFARVLGRSEPTTRARTTRTAMMNGFATSYRRHVVFTKFETFLAGCSNFIQAWSRNEQRATTEEGRRWLRQLLLLSTAANALIACSTRCKGMRWLLPKKIEVAGG